ncbi:MAG: glucose-6-phosphate dehydrogenase assembly protein OpcA [Opitutaceae bacterium]
MKTKQDTAVFDALPGMETPVSEVRRTLANVWDMEPARGKPAPSEFRASQMNLVVHFGLDSAPEDARETFQSALSFSRRYPCRIIALCPRASGGPAEVSAKIFCECYIGKSQKDMTCSEAIILTYPLEQRAYMENQASIMLESDLPLYYWPQRINSASRLGDYKLFLKEAQRVILDSAIELPETMAFVWPRPQAVRDLVHARLLPVRQNAGHFLSYIPPERLLEGLTKVEVSHQPAYAAAAKVLCGWVKSGLDGCAEAARREPVDVPVEPKRDDAMGCTIAIEWTYEGCRPMVFSFDFEKGTARLESGFTSEATTIASAVRPLKPENALAEAIFF